MDNLLPTLNAWQPRILSVLRIMAALLFLQHGTQKFFGFPLAPGAAAPQIAMFSMYWFAGVIEVLGSLLLLVGFFTRPVAFLLSGFAAAAYFIGHSGASFYPIVNRGELAALYSFVFLYIVFAGPGPWSVDAQRSTKY